eukprot:10613_1
MSTKPQSKNVSKEQIMQIKYTTELTLDDFKSISSSCRNFYYNGLGVAAQGNWHPLSLSNSVQIIMKYYKNNPKLMAMALDMLLTLANYYIMPINFDKFDDNSFKKYMDGYKYAVMIYDIITSPKLKAYLFDSAIRINSTYILLFYARVWCLDKKALNGIMKVAYSLSKHIEKHYAMSFEWINSKQFLKENSDDPLLFSSSKAAFSSAYCSSIHGYMDQMQQIEFQEGDYEELSMKKFVLQNNVLARLNIAWDFIQRELIHLHQQKQIALAHDKKWTGFGSMHIKCFLPRSISAVIACLCRAYCILKDEGYGLNRFLEDMNDKIKLLPIDNSCDDFKYVHNEIKTQMQKIKQNGWLMMHFKLMPQKQIEESLKYGADTHYISNGFKSNRKVRFLINFLRGTRCGYCYIRSKRLKMCRKCKKQRYCSKRCQKREWVKHKSVCVEK